MRGYDLDSKKSRETTIQDMRGKTYETAQIIGRFMFVTNRLDIISHGEQLTSGDALWRLWNEGMLPSWSRV